MLSTLKCLNFRSLEDVVVPLAPMTAFVGPNGSGKTSLLRAIDLVTGQVWPTIRSVRIPQDFTFFDTDRSLWVEVGFVKPLVHKDKLGAAHELPFIRFTCAPYKKSGKWGEIGDLHADLKPLNAKSEVPWVAVTPPKKGAKPEFERLNVSTALRDQARVLFIDHRRSLAQHLPGTRGSVLGRLFEPARKAFSHDAPAKADFKSKYEAALAALRTTTIQQLEETIGSTAKRMIGFLGTAAVSDVDISFGFADPANPFNSLRLVYTERGMEIPGEELGLGIQSALVVGIFEALRQRGGPIGTVVIEEPEMYLHPQAQRYFFRLLCEMADTGSCQVIYSTHSPIFADVSRFESVRLVRKEPGGMTTVSYVKPGDDTDYLAAQRAAQKIGVSFDPSRSELLFARKALLVEGPGDRLAAQLVSERLGQDPDTEDLAIVPCGSKSAIPFFIRTCNALGIPFVVLHDEDLYPEEGSPDEIAKRRKENAAAAKLNTLIAALAGESAKVFVIAPTLEAALGIGRSAKDKPRRIVEALDGLSSESVPAPLKGGVNALFA